MSKIERLLCHPYRVFVNEACNVLVREKEEWKYYEGKTVVIPVDSLDGNPDPYVFHEPWFYGYCRNFNMPDITPPQSIIIFGTYLNDEKGKGKEAFLVDTVFVVKARYNWLGKEGGYMPSETFRSEYRCSKKSTLYRDFIVHRAEKGHHLKAKAIFAAEHAQNKDFDSLVQTPHNRMDHFYSFIPLNYKDGIYNPIDILPVIKKKCPTLFDDYKGRRNRLYEADSFAVNVIDYLIKEANTLVIKTAGKGMPEKLDMDLQNKYYKCIYNIGDETLVEKNCKETCYSIGVDED